MTAPFIVAPSLIVVRPLISIPLFTSTRPLNADSPEILIFPSVDSPSTVNVLIVAAFAILTFLTPRSPPIETFVESPNATLLFSKWTSYPLKVVSEPYTSNPLHNVDFPVFETSP